MSYRCQWCNETVMSGNHVCPPALVETRKKLEVAAIDGLDPKVDNSYTGRIARLEKALADTEALWRQERERRRELEKQVEEMEKVINGLR